MASRQFGYAWLAFAGAVAVHVTDEATHNFLSVYNPLVRAIRARVPLLPLPTFTFEVWITGLTAGILLLLLLSPLAFQNKRPMRLVALPLAIIVGLFNAAGHVGYSLYMHYWAPGVYSSPLLVMAGVWLIVAADRPWR
jgi:hypothetical protein